MRSSATPDLTQEQRVNVTDHDPGGAPSLTGNDVEGFTQHDAQTSTHRPYSSVDNDVKHSWFR